MDLSKVSTREIIEELTKREAVEKLVVEPYQEYKIVSGETEITDNGPAVILRIWD